MAGTNCVPFALQNNATCGTQGAACGTCMAGQICNTAGQCLTTGTLGSNCTLDSACAGLGTGAYCKKMTSRGVTYSGGYCTLPCTTAGFNNCGPANSGDCRGGDGDPEFYGYGESAHFCVAHCPAPNSQSTCRSGYFCYQGNTSVQGFCWLNPPPAYDPGPPSNKVGNTCTTDTQCQSPPDPVYGYCIPPHDGGVSGSYYPQGYCSAECSSDVTGGICGANAFCGWEMDSNNMFTGFANCFQKCTLFSGKTEVRNGYACWTASKLDGGLVGMVFPSCETAPTLCPAGTACSMSNGYCCDPSNNCYTGLFYRDRF